MNPYTVIVSTTDIGLVRKNNEDFFCVSETINGTVCVVCDGMGGHMGGEIASKVAVNVIISFFQKEKYTDIAFALNKAYDTANYRIIEEAKKNSVLTGMGTTACSIILENNKAWIAHVGDSRIYLFSKYRRKLKRLTKDHTLIQSLLDEKIITKEEANNYSAKHTITKALGVNVNVTAEVTQIPLLAANGDTFLLCTDGLYNEVSDKLIERILKKRISLEKKSNLLLQTALNAGGHDNITFQLVSVRKKKHKMVLFKTLFLKKIRFINLIAQKAKKATASSN